MQKKPWAYVKIKITRQNLILTKNKSLVTDKLLVNNISRLVVKSTEHLTERNTHVLNVCFNPLFQKWIQPHPYNLI